MWARYGTLWAWAVVLLASMPTPEAKMRYHRGTRDLVSSRPSLDDLWQRLENNIQEQTKRLERGLPVHYMTRRGSSGEGGPHVVAPTIIEDHWDPEMTHPEDYYVNDVQPWTRVDPPPHQHKFAPRDLQMQKLASENARMVRAVGKCGVPLRRCISVASLHPEGGYKYWPRCALLHRCGDDSGCCNDPSNTCTMAQSENVDLHFFVYTSTVTGRVGVQRLTFRNDTLCSCQTGSPAARAHPAVPRIQCKCPKHFDEVQDGGACTCVCAEGNRRCKRYAKGKRFLSSSEIKCISSNECTAPTCDHGEFLLTLHRCPRRKERERYTVSSRRK